MTVRNHQTDPSLPEFDLVIPTMIVATRKQVVRMVAHEISKHIGIGERILAERLNEQEKENPSTMGEGIAITHLHISGLQEALNIFIRLKNPVDMGAVDKKDVDLICLLLTPEREGSAYLRTMARISRLLRNAQICAMLRSAQNEKAIRNVLEQNSIQTMAA